MLPGERIWGSPLSPGGRAPVALLAANMGTDRPLCLYRLLPAPSATPKATTVLGRTPGKDGRLCQVSSCTQRLHGKEQGGAQPEEKQQGGPSMQTWPHPSAGRTMLPAGAGFAASLPVPTPTPAQGAANSPVRLVLLPNLQ